MGLTAGAELVIGVNIDDKELPVSAAPLLDRELPVSAAPLLDKELLGSAAPFLAGPSEASSPRMSVMLRLSVVGRASSSRWALISELHGMRWTVS